jgi:hypothetical protein
MQNLAQLQKQIEDCNPYKGSFFENFLKKSLKIVVCHWFAKFKRLIWITSHQITTILQQFLLFCMCYCHLMLNPFWDVN